jgi:acetolactate synthase-1/2/3 large subunit
MQMTGADILVSCLIEQGVDTVFGFPGGAVLFIYDALFKRQDKIRHILTCHEQHAAHAADGYARASGKTGVVIATSGPGATNLVTGIANAYMDSIPMVAITGNVSVPLLGKDSFQEVDIAGITMPITKHNYIVKDVADLAKTVHDAFKLASSGRKGPVLIDIPKDITNTLWDYTPGEYTSPAALAEPVSEAELEEAARMIMESKRPMILAGGGIISADASNELAAFQELTGAPFSLTLMGTGALPSSHPMFLGMIGMHGSKVSSLTVSECDLLIAAGSRFSDRVICNPKTFAPNAKILHLDIDPAEINKNIRAAHSVSGDIRDILAALNRRLTKMHRPEWHEKVMEWIQAYPPQKPKMKDVFPQKIITTAWEITKGEALVTTEVGQHQMWASQFFPIEKPRTFFTSGGLGTMGFGLGAAIGAAVASPGKTVINVAGDGSFHMNLMELSTAVKLNLPVKVLVMNNNVLGMVRQWQRMFYEKRFSHTTLERATDYVMLANSFGAEGYTIESEADIRPVLEEALLSPGPAVINCVIDKDVNVVPMVPQGGSIDKPILEIACEEDA